jgi:hypothetical protein
MREAGGMAAPPVPPTSLLEALAVVPDHRRAAGRRHSLAAVLTFVCCGMLCGNKSLLAIAEWGRAHEGWCCEAFGLRRRTPCVNTLHRVLKGLNVAAFEQALREWLAPQLPDPVWLAPQLPDPVWLAPQLPDPVPLEPIAIDGKAVRGAKDQHLPGAYLLSAFAGQRSAVLAQVAIGERENELSQALPLLRQINVQDALVTGDAMFAQRVLCEDLLRRGGHYLFEVKDNQPRLHQEIAHSFRGAE